jgi:hypothetical protein
MVLSWIWCVLSSTHLGEGLDAMVLVVLRSLDGPSVVRRVGYNHVFEPERRSSLDTMCAWQQKNGIVGYVFDM